MSDRNRGDNNREREQRIEKKDTGSVNEGFGRRNENTVSFDRPVPREKDKK